MSSNTVRNTTWDELKVGDEASVERTATAQDFYLFAHVTGNVNPANLPGNEDKQPSAPSMWIGSLISAALGNRLPGPGTLYRVQNLTFHKRVRLGDKVIASVRCTEKLEKPLATFETRVTSVDGDLLAEGRAEVEVPLERIEADTNALPELILDEHDHFGKLVARAAQLPALPTAVVSPDDHNSLGGAVLSAQKGLIVPILIGERAAIEKAAAELDADISGYRLIEVDGHRAAAAKAVELINTGEARAIMKGNIHSDELLGQVVKRDGGLRTSRRISHTFVMDVPTLDHLLFISDAAINIAPDLVTKVDITQNAIDLAIACGVKQPRVGVLSAVETVNVNIPSTLDAAILSKMADRGQIRGGIVDGPLAMDNAIDTEAARTKGITSLVAGKAEILVVPNLEAGNMLAKELTFVGRAEAAGLVLGAKAPVMLTSRADNDRARLASAALAQFYDYWRTNGRPFEGDADVVVAKAAE
ncbi:bifunctional enoyl-CoA hydratase/phosphate acetyltransferase [Pseudochelatococcus contaminans]|uniref:Phosphate butyryltransferase n=1 Tax=Pseudochelatococcus contaminans TaxID=1538103 RepID=A0A7W6EFS6_9HYPH|nr:bifunctional enoyl-CoA hydratase/phosphate acetyltransferase [Pseudochelatococcus contaminans]MBB3809044.1 phosphate butyryltransferase [Pseudochelatococcus contaminans]